MRHSPLLAVLAASALLGSPARAEYDDCDSKFIAFVGSSAYQFSPALESDLGRVRLFAVLSYQQKGATNDYGSVYWRLEIRGPEDSNRLVHSARGTLRIERRGAGLAEVFWDGRGQDGQLVESGTYRYTFSGRFLPDRVHPTRAVRAYEDLNGIADVDDAQETTRNVIVNYTLTTETSRLIRESLTASSCQTQQNAPMEAGFPYNFYYGSTHSHSNYSDGGIDPATCNSGMYGTTPGAGPADVFSYARNTAGLDYWVDIEHNHIIPDALAGRGISKTEATVHQAYQEVLAAAAAANVDGTFVAIGGMEWGVTTNSDQGHVTLLETPVLFGWDTCTGTNCNLPTPTCTLGTNCYFDVYTPKRTGYLLMYQRSVEHPSSAGALGIFCHPGSSEFDNYAFDSNADEAIQGIAVRSGAAFATATDCADANIATTNYWPRYKSALNIGFHVGPTGDHDAHCINYGVSLPTRTVYLATSLTKAAILAAHKARHFYASEDSNLQLVFATTGNAHIMGDIFTVTTATTLRAAVYDPNAETVSTLQLWRGQIGGGVPSSPIVTVSNQSTLTYTDAATTGSYYYYVHGIQADGQEFWSAPMWVSYNLTCTPPATPTAANSGPICAGATLNLSTPAVTGATYSWTGPNGFTSSSQNPSIASATTAATGTYSVTVTVAGCTSAAGTTAATVSADTTAPVVTAPAAITINQTLCCGTFGGATSATSAALATFLSGGSATDDCTASPARLAPQVGGIDVASTTCFPAGTTSVTFRFQDGASHIGTATSSVTVRMFGDLNVDSTVDPSDMVVLRAYFNFVVSPGTSPFNATLGMADLSHDTVVDPSDAVILRAYFNFVVACLAS